MLNINPQANPDKYPKTGTAYATGQGFGANKGMHVSFSVVLYNWPYVLEGETW